MKGKEADHLIRPTLRSLLGKRAHGFMSSYSVLYGMIPSPKEKNKDGVETFHGSEFEAHFDRSIMRMVQREKMAKSKVLPLP